MELPAAKVNVPLEPFVMLIPAVPLRVTMPLKL